MRAKTAATMTMKVDQDDTLILHYEQDVEPTLKLNEFESNERAASHFSKPSDLMRVASIPEVVVYLWKKMFGFDLLKFHPNNPEDQKMLRRLLNDADWLKLRTSPGIY